MGPESRSCTVTRAGRGHINTFRGASYLRVPLPDGQGALVFETDAEGKVVRWRAGLPPQIDYLEGCG